MLVFGLTAGTAADSQKDAHRSNDDEPYVSVTEDFGQTWKSLRANLPTGSTRILREDVSK